MFLRCGPICGEGVREETMLAQLSAGFQSLPLLPTSKLGPSGADTQVGGFVYVLATCGSLQQGGFLLPPQPPSVFSIRGLRLYFPATGTLGCGVCLAPQSFLLGYPHVNVGPLTLPATTSPALVLWPPTCCESSPPGCLSRPILQVWSNVSALTPWLLDFHTVRFSGISGCFLFLNLLLSFFCLCEEAQCEYLRLHLGWKSTSRQFFFDCKFL